MAYIYDLTDTWNAGGTTFNAIKMNVTNTASAAASKLVTLQTSGTEHFSVTKAGVGYFSGNLGVGTTAPSEAVEISRDANPKIRFLDVGNIDAKIGIVGSTALGFEVNGAERMRIDSSGNVGIGTTTPAERLDVAGNAKITSGSSFYWGDATSQISATNAGPMRFLVGNGGEKVRIDASGNVGIGTTTPAEKFQVIGSIRVNTTSTIFSNNYSAGNTQTWLTNNASSSDTYIVADRAQRYRMLTGIGHQWETAETGLVGASITYTERMRLDTGGNLGIGTTTPSRKLSIGGTTNGYMDFTATSFRRFTIGSEAAGFVVYDDTASAYRMTIDASGNLGLGVTAFGTSAAKVIGMANATAPTTSPAGMGQLYVEGGALKFRGSSGTVTTIAPA